MPRNLTRPVAQAIDDRTPVGQIDPLVQRLSETSSQALGDIAYKIELAELLQEADYFRWARSILLSADRDIDHVRGHVPS
jgi:hypothetical protein